MLKLVDNPHLNCGDHLVVRVRLPLWVQLVINIKNQFMIKVIKYYEIKSN